MLSRHVCRRAAAAVVGAVALLASAAPAGAHSGHTTTWTLSTYALNAYPNSTTSIAVGAYELDTLEFDYEYGFLFAGSGDVTPAPQDEEEVGSVTWNAAWVSLFCAISTGNFKVTWEDDLTGGPAGAVGRLQMSGFLASGDIWVIQEATNDYKLTMDFDQASTCSSASQPSSQTFSLSLTGTTVLGSHVHQNPAASDCLVLAATFRDVSATSHTGYDDNAFGTASC